MTLIEKFVLLVVLVMLTLHVVGLERRFDRAVETQNQINGSLIKFSSGTVRCLQKHNDALENLLGCVRALAGMPVKG